MTRYVAFLSYSHRNKAETEWLHRALEHYHIPKKLVGRETAKGKVPARLIPVFRDRDELPVSADLGNALRSALETSEHLIVIASPNSARSIYVQEEIRYFKSLHGESRVFALIVGGEPYASTMPGREEEEAFPVSLRFKLGPDKQVCDIPAEPIAADIRPGKDGKRLALMKLIAGITGLRLDDLVQREAQRRARRATLIASIASAGMLVTSGLAIYANQQRGIAVEQRRVAERETAAARAATDYLIGTFELSNPATENPRTVSLVTILERAAERARTELKEQPQIETRIVTAVGRAYNNLGLLDEAETALARALPAIKRAGPDGAAALITLADTHLIKGEIDKARTTLNNADRLLGADTGKLPTLRAQIYGTRGSIAYTNGEAERALADYERALAYLARDPSADPFERANLLNGRGGILMDLGRYDDAEKSLLEANRLFASLRGEGHLVMGRNWNALALNAYNAGRYDLAELRIGKSLAILSRMLDQTNPMRADALSLQGSIYQAQGRLQDADRALESSIAAFRQVYSRPHYSIGIAELYRAQVATELGRHDDALGYLDDALVNYQASYGPVHANIGELMVIRAEILAKVGRQAQAGAQCKGGIAMLNETMGPDASFTKGLKKSCDKLLKKGVNGTS